MDGVDETLAEIDREIADARAEPPDGNALVAVDLRDVMTNMEPPVRYVFAPIVPRGEVTLLSGHGGAGKSILALTLAAHAACGRRWGPFETVQAGAVYVSLEDPARRVRSRLRRIVESYDLPADDVLAGLRVFDGSNADGTLAVEQMEVGVRRLIPAPMMGYVAAAVQGAGLIVIDNASDAYGGNENARSEVRTFIRMLAALARESDAALILAAHVDKNAAKYGGAGNNYSGSTAWHNSVRSRLALMSDDSGLLLAVEKVQDAKLPDAVRIAFNQRGVLMPQSASVAKAAAGTQAQNDAAAVLTVIRLALADGQTVSAAKGGSATAWDTLCEYPQLPEALKTKAGRKRVNAALVRLARDGHVIKQTYRNADYKTKQRFVLAENPPHPPVDNYPPDTPHTPLPSLADGSDDPPVTENPPVVDWRTTGGLAESDESAGWLANADPEFIAKLAAMRTSNA